MPIVCGTDFSPPAAAAVRVAAMLARRVGEPLSLAHVVDLRGVASGVREQLVDVARAALSTEAEPLRQAGVAVRDQLLAGAPDEAIVAHADAIGARLVVLGALGYRHGTSWLLGSVVERVAQTSSRPVLVVRDDRPFAAWAMGERPLRLMVGVDFSSTSDATIRWTAQLRDLGACDVLVVHVYQPAVERQRLGILDPDDANGSHPDVERVLLRDLAARVGTLSGAGTVEFRAVAGVGSAADRLVHLAAAGRDDVLVVGTHQRRGFARLWHGSVSSAVLERAGANVVCVPATEPAEPAGDLPAIGCVLVPTDLSPLANRAVRHAYGLAGPGATIHLLHVIDRLALPDPLYPEYPADRLPTPAEQTRQRDAITGQLRALVPPAAARRGIETTIAVVESDDVAATIAEAAERLGADLICLGSRGRTGLTGTLLGSVAQRLLGESARPLLVIRPPHE